MHHADFTVGWICALPLELTAATAVLDEEYGSLSQLQGDDNNYILGRIHGHNVVLACLPSGVYGTTSAAIVADQMRRSFPRLRFGLLVGIDGGVPGKDYSVRLGDVVIGVPTHSNAGVIQYDYGKVISGGEFQITSHMNKPSRLVLNAVSTYRSRVQLSGSQINRSISRVRARHPRMWNGFTHPGSDADILFESEYEHADDTDSTCLVCCNLLKAVRRPQRNDAQPEVHFGLIASANSVMRDAHIRDRLANRYGIKCFEMEAAGLVDNFPCLVVKGICDYADSHKNKHWQDYAAMVAAASAREVLEILPRETLERTQATEHKVAENSLLTQGDLSLHFGLTEAPDRKPILDMLSHYDHELSHHKISYHRVKATTDWFMGISDFLEWVEHQSKSFLWLSGIIGSGKTYICSRVIDHLKARGLEPAQPIIHFYCDAQQSQTLKTTYVLRSLTRQLLEYMDKIDKRPSEALLTQLRRCVTSPGPEFDFEEVAHIFELTRAQIPKAIYVIDGVDSMEGSELKKFLFVIDKMLVEAEHVKVLLASRTEVGENNRIPCTAQVSLTEEDTEQDLRKYISSEMSTRLRTQRVLSDDDTVLQDIQKRLLKESRGMFLWARLQIAALWETCHSDAQIYTALDQLPRDLPQTYYQCLKRIKIPHQPLAQKVLRWVSCAIQPLSVQELCEAAAFDLDDHHWDRSKLLTERQVISVCDNLVVLDEADYSVRLVHPSVKQFLSNAEFQTTLPYAITSSSALQCGEECVNYLSFSDFQLQLQTKDGSPRMVQLESAMAVQAVPFGNIAGGVLRKMIGAPTKAHVKLQIPTEQPSLSSRNETEFGLLSYAREGWAVHTKMLSNQSPVWAKFQKLALQPNSTWRLQPWGNHHLSERAYMHSLLAWAVREDHSPLLGILFSHATTAELKTICDLPLAEDGLPALHVAAKLGFRGAVEMLLTICDVNNTRSPSGWTPLHFAAEKNNHEVMELLLASRNVRIVIHNDEGLTALTIGVLHNADRAVSCLLRKGGKKNEGQYLLTAMRTAAQHRRADMLEEILVAFNKNSSDKDVINDILRLVISNNDLMAFKAVVRNSRSAQALIQTERTPLARLAIESGNTPVYHGLSQPGHDWSSLLLGVRELRGPKEQAILTDYLHDAVIKHDISLLELILTHPRVDVNRCNTQGNNALHSAVVWRDTEIIERLFRQRGIDVNSRTTHEGATPIHMAAHAGHYKIVALLMQEYNIDCHSLDWDLQSPLDYAIEENHVRMVALLQSRINPKIST